ncbi:glycosyltransferase [Variovorax sp. J22P240]|uniref:glycosyltransferase n=1 Tax=Variovorax sp. J22P240 TaxID=3053514 RepID=UPI0025779C80|nr:glycosyltransferase [Variovorax sp. J22P240]MDL9998091.1 glycosyltransferase [Variovorax sp. J22P240]
MRFLFVTTSFAPRGSSAAVRTVHMAKCLVEQGHDVHVLTYVEAMLTLFSGQDEALSNKVPEAVGVTRIQGGPLRRRVFGRSSAQTGEASKTKERLKKNSLVSLLVPDPHVDSVPAFIREGNKLLESFKPDVIVSFAYPFSMHWVGSALKRRSPHLKWIADYGDPWVGSPVVELPRPAWRQRLDYWIERRWLAAADWVSVTTHPTQLLYEQEFPFLKEKILVAPMGFDPEDFESIAPKQRSPELQGKVLLVHTGRIYPQARDPSPFVQALEKLAQRAPANFAAVKVVLVGEGDDHVRRLTENSSAKEAFVFVPWVPVEESIAWMKAADWLLLFGNKGGVQIPGKVFQYFGSGGRIFMPKIVASDPTADIVGSVEGSVVTRNDSEEIYRELLKISAVAEAGGARGAPGADSKYSWQSVVRSVVRTLATGKVA